MSASYPADLVAAAKTSTAWPFEEARKLVARVERRGPGKGAVLFETGYGPSGLPHIGTFGEVARTTMVRNAFRVLTEDRIPTRLICFSDDMDGMRKIPENVPNRDMLKAHLGKPLTRVPDPFGKFESFAHHNNAMLRRFLDSFGFEYEFMSSTECYTTVQFDTALQRMLEKGEEVLAIMLPSLREERAATYSPFLPVHPRTGVVMQVPIEEMRPASGTLVWRDPDTGERFETPVTGGACKAQWKPDWALRWYALDVDYEMAGKDHIEGMKLSGAIAECLGGQRPDGFNYELFLDDKGQKISKSKGNGLTIDEWLTYASPESLALFMFQKPREAKRLHFDVIPRTVDEYLQFLDGYPRQDWKNRLGNPVWHIHSGAPPAPEAVGEDGGRGVSFALLLNLVAVANAESKDVLWAFLRRYTPSVSPQTHPRLDAMVGFAVRYYADFVKPAKTYHRATEAERAALLALSARLAELPADADAATIQDAVYDVGRAQPAYQDFAAKGATPDRPGVKLDWFNTLYRILLGEERGPRFGTFVAFSGIATTRALIEDALSGALIDRHAAYLAQRKGGGPV
ncbi:MAG: lysine--tRNA ligase [Labrys sp. (in: a-proteobacteria)]